MFHKSVSARQRNFPGKVLLYSGIIAVVSLSACNSLPLGRKQNTAPTPFLSQSEEIFEEEASGGLNNQAVIDARVENRTNIGTDISEWDDGITQPDFSALEVPENLVQDWRPPPYEPPLVLRPEDHFYFIRPIPSGEVNWSHPYYRYGNTFFGESNIHTGVDMGADLGTPVLAAGDGEVIWVGYGLFRGSEDPNDPYGLAVAIRHDFGHLSQILFTVYGHMLTTNVWAGQRVSMGELIGTVGNTGHSTGPHLHFEVRLGENRYYGTRNPELWMVPPEGWGILAGRVLDTPGRTLKEYLVQIESLESEKKWQVWTYSEGTVFSDEQYNENFAISDLPAGPYEIRIDYLGVKHTAQMYIYPGMTNFFVFNGREGFNIEPELEIRTFSPFGS
jgi:murein DD-endopeptidase MepM/ murein hydrolase activator NlpD